MPPPQKQKQTQLPLSLQTTRPVADQAAGESGKRKPGRRDPEHRQQNLRAQKKHHERESAQSTLR